MSRIKLKLIGEKHVGQAEFILACIAGKMFDGGDDGLPAEPSGPQWASGIFGGLDPVDASADAVAVEVGGILANGDLCVGDGFNQSIPLHAGGEVDGGEVRFGWNDFLAPCGDGCELEE